MRSKTVLRLDKVVCDDWEFLLKELGDGTGFELQFFDISDEQAEVRIILSKPCEDICEILFDISKDDAMFIGESLVNLAKKIKPRFEPTT